MTRSNILLALAGCVLLASVCLVQAADRNQNLRFDIFEHESSENNLDVFGPESRDRLSSDRDQNRGRGIVFSNRVTDKDSNSRDSNDDEDKDSKHIGDVRGLYFYINNHQVERVATINFRENAEIEGERRFANAQLHLRGVLNRRRGEEDRNQELAVVGGTQGLAGARGVVRYERLERNSYRLRFDIQVREESQSF